MPIHVVRIMKTIFSKQGMPCCHTFHRPRKAFHISKISRICKRLLIRDSPHLAVLAYRVTQRGPGKISPAEAMTQYKFRALQPIKQHLSASWPLAGDHAPTKNTNRQSTTTTQKWQLQEPQQYQPVWSQVDLVHQSGRKQLSLRQPQRRSLESIRFRPALQPDTTGTGGSYNQQWSLLIQNHLHQYNQWHHQQLGHCHYQQVQMLHIHHQCT